MSRPTLRPGPILLGALLLGLIADLVLRAPGGPGLNLALWAVTLAIAAAVLPARHGRPLGPEARVLLGTAALLALTLAWRDAPAVKLLALFGSGMAFALVAFGGGAAWVRRTHTFAYGAAFLAAIGSSAVGGGLLLLEGDADRDPASPERGEWWRRTAPVLRGAALALPVLVVVGALFVAADAAFADLVARVFRFDAERVLEHFLVFGFFAWISAGYFRGLLGRSPLVDLGRQVSWRPSLGATETNTAALLLNLLFLAFVLVQLRTLFGGAHRIEVTPGLTYAEYARQGFFELVAVAAIVLPFLLATEHLRREGTARADRTYRILAGAQVVLLGVVMASAALRLHLYVSEYGLTVSRFFGAALLAWMAVMLLWFAVTVLPGRRELFAFGALLAGFTWIAAVVLANPDAMVARVNASKAGGAVGFDDAYAASLSADAAPTLVRILPVLPPEGRCRVAEGLLERWGAEPEPDWRSWSLSRSRARRLVSEERPRLEAAAGIHPCSEASG